jgi:hypothetical protein
MFHDRRRIIDEDQDVATEASEQRLHVLTKGILECMELEKTKQIARRVLASYLIPAFEVA